MAYRLIIIYHLKMKCATCILHCETNTKTGYASMASRSRDSSIFWAALAQRRHASSPCGHSRCPSNPSSQGCAEYKVKDVLNTNETPTSSHHAENPCNIFHSMIPQSWQISRFYIFTWFHNFSIREVSLLSRLVPRRSSACWVPWDSVLLVLKRHGKIF